MTISTAMRQIGILATFAFFMTAAVFSGCKPGEKPVEKSQKSAKEKTPPSAVNKQSEAVQPTAAANPAEETPIPDAEEMRSAEGNRTKNVAPTGSAGRAKSSDVPKDITTLLPYTVQPYDPALWQDSAKPQGMKKPDDLEKPLVDKPDALVPLDDKELVWVDKKNRHVVLHGAICATDTPLEFFATYANRAYESVLTINVKPLTVHAALLAVGAVAGHPSQFIPAVPPETESEFVPPTGTEVAIEVRWRDKDGRVFSAPAQYWVRNVKTKKELDTNWVFAGSQFVTDATTGKEYYQADSGELICLLSLPNAMLDLPRRGYGALEARSFEVFKEHLPPDGTPVTVLLKPILSKTAAAPKLSAKEIADAEPKVLAAAEVWLALLDRGEYSQCWEDASGYLKGAVERRDFVKQIGAMLKPLGKANSRNIQSKQYEAFLPAMPDGHYFVLQYKTAFAKKASAVETITLTFSKDNKWRVIRYFVR
jgi:hypothetical protein